jgi:RNA polymerase sigma factor (TIGR02999 family)
LVARQEELTRLLQAWRDGDRAALDQLTPLIYGELRKLARFHMSREAPGHTLQATALIHEAFLKLLDVEEVDWKNRKHFFAAASQTMRRLLVDYARKKRSIKRGRQAKRVPFEEAIAQPAGLLAPVDIIAFDEALTRLAAKDSRKSKVVEFWFFGGMTVEEIANTMDIGTSTVHRDLEFAKVWLARELGSSSAHE